LDLSNPQLFAFAFRDIKLEARTVTKHLVRIKALLPLLPQLAHLAVLCSLSIPAMRHLVKFTQQCAA